MGWSSSGSATACGCTVPGEFESLTLAAWVRPDALPNQNNSLMMADGWEPGEPHWQIGIDGTLILGVKAPPEAEGGPNARPTTAPPKRSTPERFGRWVHLAVVYDRGRRRGDPLRGRPSRSPSSTIEFDIPLRIGDAELGNWNASTLTEQTPRAELQRRNG